MKPVLIWIQRLIVIAAAVVALWFVAVPQFSPFSTRIIVGAILLALIIMIILSLSKTKFPKIGGFWSIIFSFFGTLIAISLAIFLAVSWNISANWIAGVSGIIFGGLCGAAAATYFPIPTLSGALGAFFGLSADVWKSRTSPQDLSKTILGTCADFITSTQQAITEFFTKTHMPTAVIPEGIIPIFLAATIAAIAITLIFGIYMRSQSNRGASQQAAPSGTIHQAAGV